MAEAAVESSRFFCHSCTRHFSVCSSDLKCPHCNSGFVEQIEENNTSMESQLSSDIDVEGLSPGGPTALDLLRASFHHYIPDIGPDENDPNAVSFFSINIRPHNDSSNGHSSSSRPAAILVRGRRRRNNDSNSSEPNAVSQPGSNPNPQAAGQLSNMFLEGLLQSIISGADPNAMMSGNGAGMFGMPFNFQLHSNPGDYAWGSNGLDDIITQLLGQLDSTGAPPASKNAIDKLPVLTITESQVAANKDCSVCMETFVVNDEAKRLPCEHFFHIDCIDPWLELHNTCPICRTNIEGTDPSSCPRTSHPSTSGPSTSGL